MNYLHSLPQILTVIIVVPFILRHIKYFHRPEAIVIQKYKQRLPSWVQAFETFVFMVSACLIGFWLYKFASYIHGLIYPQFPFIVSSMDPSFSINLLCWILKILLPIIAALALGMIVSNLVSWSIPTIRKIESQSSQGVKGANFKDLTMGIVKGCIKYLPIFIILAIISMMRP